MPRIPYKNLTQSDEMAEKLEMSTAEIGLSVRTTNCLEERGIFTVHDLLNCTRADQLGDPSAHLVGRLVGERQRHDRGGRHTLGNQIGDPVSHHPRLPAAGPCQHQQRPLDVGSGGTLRLV